MTERQYSYEQAHLHAQLEIQAKTLRNINQEIHDNIGQVLSLAKLRLNTLPALPSIENEEALITTKELVSKAITDLRSLSKGLYPERIIELGLEESIRQELDVLEKSKQCQSKLKINGSPYKLPSAVQIILFRMMQELLTDVTTFAAANYLEVTLHYQPDTFYLNIDANAIGLMNTDVNIQRIRDRSAILGATLRINEKDSSTTEVTISLPLKKEPHCSTFS